MAGSNVIRAGEAYWEATVKDKTAPGLRTAEKRVKAFNALAVAIGSTLADVGKSIATHIANAVKNAASTFISVSQDMRRIGGLSNPKADGLIAAWGELKAVFTAVFYLIGDAVAGPLTQLIRLLSGAAIGALQLAASAVQLVALAIRPLTQTITGMFMAASVAAAQFASVLTSGGIIGAFITLAVSIRAVWESTMIALEASLIKTIQNVTELFKSAIAGFVAPLKLLEKALGRNLGSGAIEAAGAAVGAGSAAIQDRILQDALRRSATLTDALNILRRQFGGGGGSASDLTGIPHLAGSAGTFSGRGASLMGIGAGGGMKTSDDETHKMLERVLNVLRALDLQPKFK